jgi:hypothetical protein
LEAEAAGREPIDGDVVGELEKPRIVAKEQFADSIGTAVAFDTQVVGDTRPSTSPRALFIVNLGNGAGAAW